MKGLPLFTDEGIEGIKYEMLPEIEPGLIWLLVQNCPLMSLKSKKEDGTIQNKIIPLYLTYDDIENYNDAIEP